MVHRHVVLAVRRSLAGRATVARRAAGGAALAGRAGRVARGGSHLPLVLAVAFGLSSVGLLANPASTFGWSSGSFSAASEQQLVALTNQARANAGRRALKVDSALTSIARWRSKDMSARNYFSHSIPPGGNQVFSVMSDRGYCFTLAGENIGWNTYPDDVATAQIQQMFMNSPSHRENILGSRWEAIGVGAYKGADGKKLWTVLFADKCGSGSNPAPKPKPTPKPTPRPQPRPTPNPTTRPKPPTLTPTPRATPRPSPKATPSPSPSPDLTPPPTPAPTPAERVPEPTTDLLPTPPAPTPTGGVAGNLRVEDPAAAPGLFDSIVAQAVAVYFGPH
jgi:uncharacterized protein YkwD